MVWKSWKTKVKFLYEIPLSVALFCMTAGWLSLSVLDHCLLKDWGPTLRPQRHKNGKPEGWRLMKVCVSVISTCQWAVFPSCPRAVLTCLRGELPHPYHLHRCLLRPLLSGMALSLSAAHLHGWGRVGRIQLKENAVDAMKGPPALGKVSQGTLPAQGNLPASSLTLWLVYPSAHCEDREAECPKAVQ